MKFEIDSIMTPEEYVNLFNEFSNDFREKLKRLYAVALEDLKDKKRLSGKPFILHPMRVAYRLYLIGSDPHSVMAGLMHHCSENKIQLLKQEDEDAYELIQKLKKINDLKERGKSFDFDISLIRTLLFTGVQDFRVLIIKLVDKVDNLKEIEPLPKDEQIRIAKDSLIIYAPIAHKLGVNELKTEIEDISLRILYPDIYNKLKKQIELKLQEAEKNLPIIQQELKNLFHDYNFMISGRVKHLYSILKKLEKRNIDEIYDILAFRIITNDVNKCYEVLSKLQEHYEPIPGRLKDYIAHPKSNGYKSIHITLKKGSIIFEVQIRTWEMHYFAEYGVAAHWKYKNIESDKLDKFLVWSKQLIELMKQSDKRVLETIQFRAFGNKIFAFTPKGDAFELPKGATALDFAFRVHSEIGYKARFAKINGKKQSIFTPLNAGDVVEIITSQRYEVNEKWLNHVKTSLAKSAIRSFLGLKAKGYNVHYELNVYNLIDFDQKFEVAGCCKDIKYLDPIVAVKTKEGYRIHKKGCKNVLPNMKIVEVRWKPLYTYISITGFDEEGILLKILQRSYGKLKIYKVDASSNKNKFTIILITNYIPKKSFKAIREMIKRTSRAIQSINMVYGLER